MLRVGLLPRPGAAAPILGPGCGGMQLEQYATALVWGLFATLAVEAMSKGASARQKEVLAK
jgi:hypothetical protein